VFIGLPINLVGTRVFPYQFSELQMNTYPQGMKRLRDDDYVYQDDRGYTVYDSSPATPYKKMKSNVNQYRRPKAVGPQVQSYVKRTPGGNVVSERKYFDTEVSDVLVSEAITAWTGTLTDPATINTLFAPTQGNDISNREGRSCWVYNVKISGVVIVNPTDSTVAADDPPVIRLILCMDKQTNGTQMVGTDLIGSGTGAPMLYGFQNTSTFGRFQVLKDITLTCPPFNIAWDVTNSEFKQSSVSMPFKMKYKWKSPLKVDFNNTNGGTVADITNNSFHLLAAESEVDTPVGLSYKCRVSFCG